MPRVWQRQRDWEIKILGGVMSVGTMRWRDMLLEKHKTILNVVTDLNLGHIWKCTPPWGQVYEVWYL